MRARAIGATNSHSRRKTLPESVSPEPAPRPATPAEALALNRPWVFAAALSASFMAAIESTIIATAMPSIVGTLGDFELFSWVFTAYLLAQAMTIPVYGRLADLYGRKPILLFGIGLFLVASLLCGFAWSMISLVAFRVLQGLGAGAVMPVSQTIIGDLYRGEERARMQGYISATFGSAAILGPIVGAALVAHSGWPMVFWFNIPLGVGAIVLLAITLRENIQRRKVRIDYLGSALMTFGTAVLMLALVQAASLSTIAFGSFLAVSALTFTLFVVHERRTPDPILPLRLWRNRFVTTGNLNALICGAAMMGIIGFLPAYVQGVMGQSAFVAGMTLMGMSASWSIGGFAAGQAILRMPYRTAALLGAFFMIAGSLLMVLLDPSRPVTWAIAASIVMGFGMGLTNNCFVVSIQVNAAWEERGVATSSIVYSRIVGQSVGTAAFGGILNAGLAGHIQAGGDLVNRILEPTLRAAIPAAEIAPIMAAFDHALHHVYLINLVLAVLVLITVAAVPAGQRLQRL